MTPVADWRDLPAGRKRSMLVELRTRRKAAARRRYPTPGALAKELDGSTVNPPHLQLIDAALVRVADGQCKRLLITMPPQEGKQIAHATPVFTPRGWKQHGDLRVGDEVFHPSGLPVRVVELHAEELADDRVLVTSTGARIVCHPRHEWTVFDRARGEWRTLETEQIERRALRSGPAGRGGRWTLQLPMREALHMPDVDLPMDPYTLGLWLGDGSAGKPCITHAVSDEPVVPYVVRRRDVHPATGVVTTYYAGMWTDLCAAGQRNGKHVPEAYLRSSELQRRALLAGLVDSDGSVDASGQVLFANCNALLADAVEQLVRSLGYRAGRAAREPRLSGIQGKQQVHIVTWTPHDGGPGTLERKAGPARLREGRTTRQPQRRCDAIVAVERCEAQLGRCITVDSPDGLYLVGEHLTPTHNSERTSHYGALWLLLQDPELRIAIASYEQETARRWGQVIRNDLITYQLGLDLREDSRAAARWNVAGHRGGVYCVGIGGALTGRAVDVMLIDDPVKDAKAADSDVERETAWSWWTTVARTRLAPNAPVILIMTRWHEADLAGMILAADSEGEWEVLHIPAIADHKPEDGQVDPIGREVGEALPSARDWEPGRWESVRRDVGERSWNALYQGRPAPADGDIWKRAWWGRYGLPLWDVDADGAHWLPWAEEVIASWDMAFKDTKGSDFVVGQVWATMGSEAFLVDQVRDRMNFSTTLEATQALRAKWPQTSATLVEDKANGSAVLDSLRKKVPGLIPITPKESKQARASAVAPFLEATNVYVPTKDVALFGDSLVEEGAAFPNGVHDDQVDCASQALNRIYLAARARLIA